MTWTVWAWGSAVASPTVTWSWTSASEVGWVAGWVGLGQSQAWRLSHCLCIEALSGGTRLLGPGPVFTAILALLLGLTPK